MVTRFLTPAQMLEQFMLALSDRVKSAGVFRDHRFGNGFSQACYNFNASMARQKEPDKFYSDCAMVAARMLAERIGTKHIVCGELMTDASIGNVASLERDNIFLRLFISGSCQYGEFGRLDIRYKPQTGEAQ